MECEMQNLIHAYADGELDLVKGLEVERHIQNCQSCSRDYENIQVLRSRIRAGSLYFTPPVSLRKCIQSSVRREIKSKTQPHIMQWRWLSIPVSLAFIAITIWAIEPILTTSSMDHITQEIISGHVRSLMADHLTDVASSDQHTVKPWFNGRLDFSPPVKDLSDHGFPLVGGRLDYLENRPVAALVYRHRKHFINLFIWPSAHGSDIGKKTLASDGYNLIHWEESGMVYWAVSDLNIGELQEFVQLIQNQAS